jgi:hypothetical protein
VGSRTTKAPWDLESHFHWTHIGSSVITDAFGQLQTFEDAVKSENTLLSG